MASIIDISRPCPKCDKRMYFRVDRLAVYLLKRLADPDEYGCEPNHYYCRDCDLRVER